MRESSIDEPSAKPLGGGADEPEFTASGGSGCRGRIQDLEGRKVKVLFMSGYSTAQSMGRCSECGEPFVQKPFQPEEVARQVRAVLDA